MALRGYLAKVKAESSALAFTDEATTTSDNLTYIITDANKRVWAYNSTVVVKVDAVAVTTGFTLKPLTGEVVFDTSQVGSTITITGEYVTLTTLAEAKSFSFAGSSDALDQTKFEDTYRSFQAGLRTATAEIGEWYLVADIFYPLLVSGDVKVIEYYVDATNVIRFYAFVISNQINAPLEGLIDQAISLQVTTDFTI